MSRKISKKVVRENISTYLRMREMWIGLFIVVLILGVGAKAVSNFVSKGSNIPKDLVTMNQSKLTPELIPAISTVSGELESGKMEREESVLPTTVLTPTPTEEAPKITVLANTSGYPVVIAQKNDNFWKIAERVCGNGRYNLSVQRYNGYGKKRALQPGDAIEVVCVF